MNTPYLFRRWGLLLLLCVLAAGLVSCAEEVESGPRAWIDFPRNGFSVPTGDSVSVMSHAYAREGVAEVLLLVNGEAYRRDPPVQPGASFSKVTQEWRPEKEGRYTLEVVTYDTAGEASKPAKVMVRVGGEIALKPTEEPTAEPIEEPIVEEPTEEPVAEPTEEPTLEPTEEPTEEPAAEPTEEPALPPQVSFTADDLSLEQGECTTLRWEVENATTVLLDNEVVAERGSQQVCPASTSTYNLQVEAPGGNVDRSLTINVAAPPPPPAVSLQPEGQVTIEQGECLTVRWDVENATAVYINGQDVAGHGSQQVCPTSTTTYNLHVEAPGGNVDKSLTINVAAPPPPPTVSLQPEGQVTIEQGECLTIRWDVENATAVYINDQGVTGHGSQQVCPKSTTTYNLHVEAPGGNVDKSLTINVEIPVDTTPPPVPTPLKPQGNLPDCFADVMLRWSAVSDESGIAGYYIKREMKVKQDWQTAGGWGPVSGEEYKVEVECGPYYRWRVRAQDGAGNYSDWSSWLEFSLPMD
ncbi:MAG: PT domain-containing protein [Anaerolineae bacterium]|nr:PT domain-containing protein [Anaerolineae bacterium]